MFFMVSGCQTISNWTDSLGEHMPVIGERCEHWQCFTESGRAISDENKRKMQQEKLGQQQQQQPVTGNAANPAPAQGYPDIDSQQPGIQH